MKRTSPITTRFILIVFLSIIVFESVAQKDTLKLSNVQINEILDKIDTLSSERNYHVLLKSGDNETLLVYVWINDRLGETMFEGAGINICRFYTFKQSIVFVYEYRQCDYNISPNFLRNQSLDPYAYLTESPFYVENGFHQAFIVKMNGSNLEFTELELINKNGIDQDFRDIIGR